MPQLAAPWPAAALASSRARTCRRGFFARGSSAAAGGSSDDSRLVYVRPAASAGPSTSPLEVMRCVICLIVALAGLGSVARADAPECQPKRAVLSIPAFYGSLPRVPPVGYVEVAFTVAPTGKPQDMVVLSSQIDWPEAPARALQIVASAQFDPPSHACRQTMKVNFTAK